MVQLSQDLTNSVSNIGGGVTPSPPLGAVPAGAVRDALVREVDEVGQVGRLWEACQPESQPRGRQYSVPSVAGEAQAGGCGWQSRALDHWRALECLSQKPAERRWDRIKRPRLATGCGNEQKASRLWGDVCSLQQQSAASGVRGNRRRDGGQGCGE